MVHFYTFFWHYSSCSACPQLLRMCKPLYNPSSPRSFHAVSCWTTVIICCHWCLFCSVLGRAAALIASMEIELFFGRQWFWLKLTHTHTHTVLRGRKRTSLVLYTHSTSRSVSAVWEDLLCSVCSPTCVGRYMLSNYILKVWSYCS